MKVIIDGSNVRPIPIEFLAKMRYALAGNYSYMTEYDIPAELYDEYCDKLYDLENVIAKVRKYKV